MDQDLVLARIADLEQRVQVLTDHLRMTNNVVITGISVAICTAVARWIWG